MRLENASVNASQRSLDSVGLAWIGGCVDCLLDGDRYLSPAKRGRRGDGERKLLPPVLGGVGRVSPKRVAIEFSGKERPRFGEADHNTADGLRRAAFPDGREWQAHSYRLAEQLLRGWHITGRASPCLPSPQILHLPAFAAALKAPCQSTSNHRCSESHDRPSVGRSWVPVGRVG